MIQNPAIIENSENLLDSFIDGTIRKINGNNIELKSYAFANRSHLTSVDFPACTTIGNNAFQYSQKVPAYFEATMPTSVKMNQTLRTTENVRIGRQKAGLAALVHGGTESTNNEAITETNFKEEFLKDRKILVDKFAKPNVAITSTEVYNIMLKLAGTEFTPSTNENVVTTGQVGYWMGILWIEAPLLGGSLSFLNESGVEQAVDTANIDYILYDYKAYSIIDKLTMLRVIDSEDFAGSKIQEEIDTGFKVTNADCVLVRKHL